MPGRSRGQEFDLIERFLRDLDIGEGVALGNGDDAALLQCREGEALAVSVDAMHEGRHFPPDSPPTELSYRAVAAAASDLAAMGARPLGMTLALSLPEVSEPWLGECREGLAQACRDFALPLVGGDLVRGPLSLTVQVSGAVRPEAALRRSGARPGDRVWVSGCLGDAAGGLAVLRGELETPQKAALLASFWRPTPELRLGQSLVGRATSAIDVSDGLLADLGHIARASEVALVIESARLPLSAALRQSVSQQQALKWALSGGEDFKLCFTLPPGEQAPAPCVEIGYVTAGSGVHCDFEVDERGYSHF